MNGISMRVGLKDIKMRIGMIVAMTQTRGIGYKGDIPWNHPEDLRRFRKITGHSPLIMGRKTWESLPIHPLPNRMNIVMTRHPEELHMQCDGMITVSSSGEAIQVAKSYGSTAWVIGGQAVYETFINHPLLDMIYTTVIPGDYKCDTFFTEIPPEFDIVTQTPSNNSLIYSVYSKSSISDEIPSPNS